MTANTTPLRSTTSASCSACFKSNVSGLSQIDIEAGFDGRLGDFEMRVIRRGDGDEIDPLVGRQCFFFLDQFLDTNRRPDRREYRNRRPRPWPAADRWTSAPATKAARLSSTAAVACTRPMNAPCPPPTNAMRNLRFNVAICGHVLLRAIRNDFIVKQNARQLLTFFTKCDIRMLADDPNGSHLVDSSVWRQFAAGYHSGPNFMGERDIAAASDSWRNCMSQTINRKRLGWILLGVLVGFLLSVFMPAQPLHAVATSGLENFQLSTGLLDNTVEGVYFLDGLTGILEGAAMNVINYQFTTVFETNVLNDMKLDPSKSPKFLMVTGLAELRRTATQFQPGLAVIYIAELNSGTLAAYGVQWNIGRTTQATPAPLVSRFVLLQTLQLRNVAVRPQ